MSPVQAAVLGAVQGLTEFLPVSSSAHLFIIPTLLGWPYAGLAFDVALHWGTLIALVVAFWRDWLGLFRDALAGVNEARSTLAKLVVCSIPAAVVGLLFEDTIQNALRSLPLQALMLFVFGFLLWFVDRVRPNPPSTDVPGWGASLLVGSAQALALVPGVSRSGITMTAGRATGLGRVAAARYSFLLATPITLGAGLLELRKLPSDLEPGTLAIGVVVSAVVGLIAIRGLLRWLGRAGFGAFFAYRAALAGLILFTLARA
jgi:undecaprenyl-diphosphatase